MSIPEIVCPVCKTNHKPEAVVCENCGARLDNPFMDLGSETKTTDIQALTPEVLREWSLTETAAPDKGIAFHVEGWAKPAYFDPAGDFVLGRKSGATSETLLDLAPFGGYGMGVSRRHAVIRRTETSYEVIDLGSVNGTWVGEARLSPHKPYPLPSGSHLRLGRMRLYVLYQSVV